MLTVYLTNTHELKHGISAAYKEANIYKHYTDKISTCSFTSTCDKSTIISPCIWKYLQ